jgi:2-C-methyl-D-erythritol 4-phosphate cytidylyltransferase
VGSISVIIAAAGNSTRFEGIEKKTLAQLNGQPVWLYSANLFARHPQVVQQIVSVSPDDLPMFTQRFGSDIDRLKIDVVAGGEQRCDSVQKALSLVASEADFVAIHDGARPCFTLDMFAAVVDAARQHGAAIPAVPVNSTVKRANQAGLIEATVDRSGLFLAQTPQVFRRQIIQAAYENRSSFQPTDEAALLEDQNVPVAIVPGSKFNIKITQSEDLRFAKSCLVAVEPTQVDAPIDERLRR